MKIKVNDIDKTSLKVVVVTFSDGTEISKFSNDKFWLVLFDEGIVASAKEDIFSYLSDAAKMDLISNINDFLEL
nr:hypothetical protein 35 [bacterium]